MVWGSPLTRYVFGKDPFGKRFGKTWVAMEKALPVVKAAIAVLREVRVSEDLGRVDEEGWADLLVVKPVRTTASR